MRRCGPPRLLAVSDRASVDAEIRGLLDECPQSPVLRMSDELFAQLAPVEHPVGIVALVDTPRVSNDAPLGDLSVMLDGVQDPGNVGTIIRCAAAAGAHDVLLSVGCADAWSPRTLRAAMGGHFALNLRTDADLDAALADFAGIAVAAASTSGVPPEAVDLRGQVAIVLGSEGAGVRPGLLRAADAHIAIPMAPAIESLNVAAAAAIVLYERMRQLRSDDQARRGADSRARAAPAADQ
jgi:TrmH family RNA methyltransferase